MGSHVGSILLLLDIDPVWTDMWENDIHVHDDEMVEKNISCKYHYMYFQKFCICSKTSNLISGVVQEYQNAHTQKLQKISFGPPLLSKHW